MEFHKYLLKFEIWFYFLVFSTSDKGSVHYFAQNIWLRNRKVQKSILIEIKSWI